MPGPFFFGQRRDGGISPRRHEGGKARLRPQSPAGLDGACLHPPLPRLPPACVAHPRRPHPRIRRPAPRHPPRSQTPPHRETSPPCRCRNANPGGRDSVEQTPEGNDVVSCSITRLFRGHDRLDIHPASAREDARPPRDTAHHTFTLNKDDRRLPYRKRQRETAQR